MRRELRARPRRRPRRQSPTEPSNAALEAETSRLEEAVRYKGGEIERLSKKRKAEDDLREEIDTLQDNLVNTGQDHVEAKEKIKTLEDKATLRKRIAEFEDKVGTWTSNAAADSQARRDLDKLREEHEDLKDKSATLRSDLGAAQQLAQPELKSLRQASAELKTAREELAAKARELREAEWREKDLGRDLSWAQKLSADGEAGARGLEKLKAEGTARQQAEEARRGAERGRRRAEADKVELSAKTKKAERELQRARVKELEEQTHQLRRERAREAEELRMAVAQLRAALDASEKQMLDRDWQRAELRRLLDEARRRHERAAKEAEARAARASPPDGGGPGAASDTPYLKTILLQFLEQKDGRLRAQLVPVLGKLLKLDR